MGIALGALAIPEGRLREEFPRICHAFARTRPTAVNLFWAIERITDRFEKETSAHAEEEHVRKALVDEACRIHAEDIKANRLIGTHGRGLIRDGDDHPDTLQCRSARDRRIRQRSGLYKRPTKREAYPRSWWTKPGPLLQGRG